jgi:nitroreductase/FMN reductase [NAD(P)H]
MDNREDSSAALVGLGSQLALRFGEDFPPVSVDQGVETLARIAGRGSVRSFTERPVDPNLVNLLLGVAFSSPTKSDLQQRDVIVVDDPELRFQLHDIIRHRWLDTTPTLLVICGNNRRQRQLHEWRRKPFANDHLDAFFNASVDAAILLATLVVAAEAVGLGACPLSQIRNDAARASQILGLPDHVFPVAALALGWPAEAPAVTPRLPLALTVHRNRFDDDKTRALVEAYDRRRADIQPYARQRDEAEHGAVDDYGWSEEKARHYAKPERAGFGQFIRDKGFRLT